MILNNDHDPQAADYWASVPTTIDGMLGGFAKISHTDIDGSNKLLKSLFKVGEARQDKTQAIASTNI